MVFFHLKDELSSLAKPEVEFMTWIIHQVSKRYFVPTRIMNWRREKQSEKLNRDLQNVAVRSSWYACSCPVKLSYANDLHCESNAFVPRQRHSDETFQCFTKRFSFSWASIFGGFRDRREFRVVKVHFVIIYMQIWRNKSWLHNFKYPKSVFVDPDATQKM